MTFVPPASIRQVGDLRWRRFVIRDGAGHYWTGHDWSEVPSTAQLFLREADAVRSALRTQEQDNAPETFKATVTVSVKRGAWTLEKLAKYLKEWGRFLLMRSAEARAVNVAIHWDGLEPDDGEAEWTRRDE